MVWFICQCLLIAGNRFIPSALLSQDVGEIEICRGGIWTKRNRALVARDRVGRSALLAADIAEVEVGQRIIVSNVDRAHQMSRDIVIAIERAARQGDIVVIFRNPTVDVYRPAEQVGQRCGACRGGGGARRRLCAGTPRGSPLFPVHVIDIMAFYRWLKWIL